MKILIYEWNGYCQKDTRLVLERMGHHVERIGYVIREKCKDEFFEGALAQRLQRGYDCVFSYNFYPSVARCCRNAGIPYLSWIYDGEDYGLYHETASYETNYIFTFDSAMREKMSARGVSHIWYLPLGVNLERLEQIKITEPERKRYRAEISFVGNLYQNKTSLDEYSYFPYLKGYLEGIIRAQECINFSLFLPELLTPELSAALQEKLPARDERYRISPEELLVNLLTTSVTRRERYHKLTLLAAEFPVELYTFSQLESAAQLTNHGVIDYFSDMPKLFQCSRINLNMTHRMIQSGIPLRVLDVMGAGGFLMSNYQSDMGEEFVDGEQLALYYSAEELVEKCRFYLTHEEERTRIARNGQLLIRRCYGMEQQFEKMLKTVQWN